MSENAKKFIALIEARAAVEKALADVSLVISPGRVKDARLGIAACRHMHAMCSSVSGFNTSTRDLTETAIALGIVTRDELKEAEAREEAQHQALVERHVAETKLLETRIAGLS